MGVLIFWRCKPNFFTPLIDFLGLNFQEFIKHTFFTKGVPHLLDSNPTQGSLILIIGHPPELTNAVSVVYWEIIF